MPTVKRFLNKVKKGDDDLYYFQDVIIKDFENAKDDASRKKNEWVTVISEAVDARLKSDDTAPPNMAFQSSIQKSGLKAKKI